MRDLAEPLPSWGDADLAAVGSLFADPARCKVLLALDDGRALPASVLAEEAGVSRSTASSHLGKLTDVGMLRVETHGRHRYYRLAGPEVAELLEHLVRLAPPLPVTSLREGTRAARLRTARTCYDHLAGALAIVIVESLIARRWLHPTSDNLEPAPALLAWLADRGHPVATSKRPLSRACLDWTERVPHVAGRVGAALASTFLDEGWVTRVRDTRALRLTAEGREALAVELGVSSGPSRSGPHSDFASAKARAK